MNRCLKKIALVYYYVILLQYFTFLHLLRKFSKQNTYGIGIRLTWNKKRKEKE